MSHIPHCATAQAKQTVCRTCDQSYVGVFGVVGTPGHPTDCVSQHLQGVSLLNHTHTQLDACINLGTPNNMNTSTAAS